MARYTNPLDLGYIRYIGYTNHHWTSDLEDLAEIWDMEGSGVYEPWQGLDCGNENMWNIVRKPTANTWHISAIWWIWLVALRFFGHASPQLTQTLWISE